VSSPSAADRALALLASGWATPQRTAEAARAFLDAGALLDDPASARRVLEALVVRAGREAALPDAAALVRVRVRFAALGVRLHVLGEAGYPSLLAQAWPEGGAPLWLAVRAPGGSLPEGPAAAVVGTREPSLDGLRTATELGRVLARHGITVVSGLARGIDQAAHRGALEADGRTVAVLGAGFDVDYPRGTRALREEVAESGGLATELAPAAPPRPRHFLERNRIISGLADVVVVVEGRERSGALATAARAGQQGREVWAVPGSLSAPTSEGPLALIRDGATLLTSFDELVPAVLAAAARRGAAPPPPGSGAATATDDPATAARTGHDHTSHDHGGGVPPPGLSAPAARLLALLGAVPATGGALAGAAGLPLPVVLSALAELTARDLAVATHRGYVRG
jgi:DNA processing protein